MASFEIKNNGGLSDVVLASCLGDDDTGGGLFSFDGSSLERLDRLSSTGIAVAEDRVYRLLRTLDDVNPLGEVLIYDCKGVVAYHRIDGLSDSHDILWDGQHIIAVSSFNNTIFWISRAGDIERKWQAAGELDSRHLNSILLKDGKLHVCAFGRFLKHREWAETTAAGAGIVFELSTDRDVITGLTHPHHPRFLDNSWVVCNSLTAELLRIDPLTGVVTKRLQLEGYPRGIAVCDDLLFVGESANRRLNPGTSKSATIVVITRDGWKVLDRIRIPCREIYDLVVAPKKMLEGLRNGFRTNRLRAAEQDQYAMFEQVGVQPARLWAVGDPLAPEDCRVRIEAKLPSHAARGFLIEQECVVENLGSAILVSAPPNPIYLSYKWIDPDSGLRLEGTEGLRSKLPHSLPPQRSAICKMKIRTPAVEGRFLLRVTLVQEEIAWFDDLSTDNGCEATVSIEAPAVGTDKIQTN